MTFYPRAKLFPSSQWRGCAVRGGDVEMCSIIWQKCSLITIRVCQQLSLRAALMDVWQWNNYNYILQLFPRAPPLLPPKRAMAAQTINLTTPGGSQKSAVCAARPSHAEVLTRRLESYKTFQLHVILVEFIHLENIRRNFHVALLPLGRFPFWRAPRAPRPHFSWASSRIVRCFIFIHRTNRARTLLSPTHQGKIENLGWRKSCWKFDQSARNQYGGKKGQKEHKSIESDIFSVALPAKIGQSHFIDTSWNLFQQYYL